MKRKFGVDIIDQMARKYIVRAGSRRWSVHVFYNILDLAAINSWILYRKVTGINISRHDFILQLVNDLCVERTTSAMTQRQESNSEISEQCTTNNKRRQCQVNRNCKKNNRACKNCTVCKKAVCEKCIKYFLKLLFVTNATQFKC